MRAKIVGDGSAITGITPQQVGIENYSTLETIEQGGEGGIAVAAVKAPDVQATVPTLTALRAFDRDNRVNYVYMAGRTAAGDGGGGVFRWDTTDLSAQVTADPLSGIYVAPATASTGSSGAWARIGWDGSVKAFGAKADGVTDDTAAVEAANAAAAIKGGTVYFPPGTYVLSYLKLRSLVTYEGDGEASVLMLKAGTNDDLITLNTASVLGFKIRNLMLNGNKANNSAGSAIRLYRADDGGPMNGDNDVRAYIEYLWIKDWKDSGIETDGPGAGTGGTYYNVRNLILNNVQIRSCDKYGMDNVRLTDSKITNVVASGCRLGGYKYYLCANLQITNVKGYYNSIDDSTSAEGGMLLAMSNRITINNYEAQEEYRTGIKISGCNSIILNGVILDSNGYPQTTNQTGLIIYNSSNISGTVLCDSFHAPGFLQNIGVDIHASDTAVGSINLNVVAQNNATNSRVRVTGTGEVTKTYLVVNGKESTYGDSTIRQYGGSSTATDVYDIRAYHTGNDAFYQIDPLPAAESGEATFDLFRLTNTTGAPRFRIFRGDNTGTVDHQLSAGLRNAELCRNGGRYNTGHLTVGQAHYWLDGFSAPRFNVSEPSSALDGSPLGLKVTAPANASSSGAPGQWAADTSFLYIYTGDGTTHTWRRVAIAAW